MDSFILLIFKLSVKVDRAKQVWFTVINDESCMERTSCTFG